MYDPVIGSSHLAATVTDEKPNFGLSVSFSAQKPE